MESVINPAERAHLVSAAAKPEKSADAARTIEPQKTPVSTAKPIVLPEDIVTLSSSKSDVEKKPSVPVTNDEKSALLHPDRQQYNFSIYG